MNVTTIGDLLKQRRRAPGSTVSRWETGESTPNTDQIDALVDYLGVSEPTVLSAIHRQTSPDESEDRVVRMLAEVLAGQDEIRRRQDELERLLREGPQPTHPSAG